MSDEMPNPQPPAENVDTKPAQQNAEETSSSDAPSLPPTEGINGDDIRDVLKTIAEQNQTKQSQPEGWASFSNTSDQGDGQDKTKNDNESQRTEGVRESIIRPLIEKRFPEKDFQVELAGQRGKPLDQLDDEDIGYAARLAKEYRMGKEKLLSDIANTETPTEALENYLQDVITVTEELGSSSDINVGSVDRIVKATDTSERGELYRRMVKDWKERFVRGDTEKLKVRQKVGTRTFPSEYEDLMRPLENFITETSGILQTPRPPFRPLSEVDELYSAFVEASTFCEQLSNETDDEKDLRRKISSDALDIGLKSHKGEQMSHYLEAVKGVQNEQDKQLQLRFVDIAHRYIKHHSIDAVGTKGLVEGLLPALRRKDADVAILLKATNMWAMTRDEFGAADLLTYIYTQPISPETVNKMLLINKTVPTTEAARLDQNRKDGLVLMGWGGFRDFIHDQRPGVHDVISAMIQYHDNPSEETKTVLFDLRKRYMTPSHLPQQQYSGSRIDDLSLYDAEVKATVDGKDKIEPGIEVLRRLYENTKPVKDQPPITTNGELNTIMASLHSAEDPMQRREILGSASTLVNNRLASLMKEGAVGIDPGTLQAVGWLDRQGFEVLQGLSYEDQMGAYKADWFRSLLRLQELSTSPGQFNEEEFESFLKQLDSVPLDRDTDRTVYKMIGNRVVEHVGALARKYKKEGFSEMSGALWSGNLTHELVGLIDPHPAKTEYGKRHRRERMSGEEGQLRGD